MKYIVVGSNLICMIAALRIKDVKPQSEVTIVDKSSSLGANMRTVEFSNHIFDQGMQNWYDTGIEWVDSYIREALEHSKVPYTVHQWPFHDNSGLIYNGHFQKNSPYINVSNFNDVSSIEKRIRQNVKTENKDNSSNIMEYLSNRFGFTQNTNGIDDFIKKYSSLNGEIQAKCFEKMLPLDRVLCDRFTRQELNNSSILRSYVAYDSKDQVPKSKNSGKFTVYPTHGGVSQLVEAFKSLLKTRKIKVKMDSAIHYNHEHNKITFTDKNNNNIDYDSIIFGSNLGSLAKEYSESSSEKYLSFSKLDSHIVHVVSSKPLNNSGLIYLFDLSKSSFNRITFYGELTKLEKDYKRATFELVKKPKDLKNEISQFMNNFNIADAPELQISEPISLPWPPYFPPGIEDFYEKLSVFVKNIKNVDYLISSDPSKGSILMFPTAGIVFENFI